VIDDIDNIVLEGAREAVLKPAPKSRRRFLVYLLGTIGIWIDKKASAAGLMRGGLLTGSSGRKMESAFPKGGGEEIPIVRIDLIEGKSEEYRAQVGDIVYQTLVDVLNVPTGDRFQVITEHRKGALLFDPDYLGVHRTDDCIFFQITLNAGRSMELKQSFYKELTERLHQGVKLRKEDVFINLVEVPKENWSYGNGLAQYVSH
jgi:4-oxalocrotonate tautomerase